MNNLSPRDLILSFLHRFERDMEELGPSERKVIEHALHRRALVTDPNEKIDTTATAGERLADAVARFGGSWRFILFSGAVLVAWVVVNSVVLGSAAYDPYPYVFLNLVLSMLAALQAPVIMMSQNRQSTKDRMMATHDYEVNLKAEIEIMALHEKFDALRSEQLMLLIARQQEQLDLLTRVLQQAGISAGKTS